MKAAVCRAFGEPLAVEELELAPPDRGEARVRVEACAICSSDIAYARGAWGGVLPAVYGHEAAGVVEEVGADVRRVRAGDRVVVSLLRSCGRCFFCERGESHLCETELPGDELVRLRDESGEAVHAAMHTGAFAEEVVVDESQIVPVPSSVPLESASLLACGVITGLGAVWESGVGEGSSVVVIGAGGVGLNSVQGAALRGAEPIVAADVSPAKLDAALEFGATHAVDVAELEGEVRALTDGRGADFAFVTVGSAKAVEQAVACVRRGGTCVVVGMPPAREVFRVVAVDLAYNAKRIVGSRMGSARVDVAIPELVSLYEQGRLKLDELITGRFPLELINEAIASVGDGSTLRNVIVARQSP